MNINLHIQRLIVDDASLSRAGREQLRQGVSQALAETLLSQGLPQNIHNLSGQKVIKTTAAGNKDSAAAEERGRGIGQAVYRGISNAG